MSADNSIRKALPTVEVGYPEYRQGVPQKAKIKSTSYWVGEKVGDH